MNIKFKDILKTKLFSNIVDYLKLKYNKSNSVFTAADPYGQLVDLQAELTQTNIAYIDKALRSLDINDPANNNIRMIRSIARFANHDAFRGRAARGVIMLKYKPGVDISTSIPGGEIYIKDLMQLKCISNGKTYSINLGVDSIKYSVQKITDTVYLNVVQGFYKETGFTGNGLANQSFSVQIDNIGQIDQDNYKFIVGGEVWKRVLGRQDMLPNDKVYYTRTGIDSTLDIYTGDNDNGLIIPASTPINVKYLITDGQSGNIVNSATNDFKFIDEILDSFGNPIDVDNIFDIYITTNIDYGSDGESLELTKALLPNITSSNVMMLPKHYEFYFKRLNIFSVVRAFKSPSIDRTYITNLIDKVEQNTILLKSLNDNNSQDISLKNLIKSNLDIATKALKIISSISQSDVINVVLVPDIRKYFGSKVGIDYFSVSQDAFYLTQDEIDRIVAIIQNSGVQTVSSEFNIIQPKPARYVVNVIARLYNDVIDTNIKSSIRNLISNYMLNSTRNDRIPPSDIIALVENIDGVDSADVSFISEANEKYHLEYNNLSVDFQIKNNRIPLDGEIKMNDGSTYDKNRVVSLDTVLGDAVFNSDEIFMLRGGWYDRNNNYYSDNADGKGYCALNIIFTSERSKR